MPYWPTSDSFADGSIKHGSVAVQSCTSTAGGLADAIDSAIPVVSVGATLTVVNRYDRTSPPCWLRSKPTSNTLNPISATSILERPVISINHQVTGRGIGLALVRELTLAMDGRVDLVDAKPGAEFRLTFPIAVDLDD